MSLVVSRRGSGQSHTQPTHPTHTHTHKREETAKWVKSIQCKKLQRLLLHFQRHKIKQRYFSICFQYFINTSRQIIQIAYYFPLGSFVLHSRPVSSSIQYFPGCFLNVRRSYYDRGMFLFFFCFYFLNLILNSNQSYLLFWIIHS